jgi:hypothetical protein
MIESLTYSKFYNQIDSIFDYCKRLLMEKEINNEIFGMSMTLFHYYTYFNCFGTFDKYKLIVSCIYFSGKLNQSNIIADKIQSIHKKYKNEKISIEDISTFELEIAHLLGYEFDLETPYYYISCFFKTKEYNRCVEKFSDLKDNTLNLYNMCFSIINDSYRRDLSLVFNSKMIALCSFIIGIFSILRVDNINEDKNINHIKLNDLYEIYETFKQKKDNENVFYLCLSELVGINNDSMIK